MAGLKLSERSVGDTELARQRGGSRRVISIERSEILSGSEAVSDARTLLRPGQSRFFNALAGLAWNPRKAGISARGA